MARDWPKQLGVPLLLGVGRVHFGADGERCLQLGRLCWPGRRAAGPLRQDAPGDVRRVHAVCRVLPLASAFHAADRQCRGGRSSRWPSTWAAFACRRASVTKACLSHVIRRQVNALAAEGREPDVLVNLTNDGWFWGSSELDLHLACGVFRAVECRKPLLIAANTGFSAWIDGDGRIREQGPRRARDVIVAEPRLDGRRVGIWPTATGSPARVWRCAGYAVWWGYTARWRGAASRRHRRPRTPPACAVFWLTWEIGRSYTERVTLRPPAQAVVRRSTES